MSDFVRSAKVALTGKSLLSRAIDTRDPRPFTNIKSWLHAHQLNDPKSRKHTTVIAREANFLFVDRKEFRHRI